jgi:uncharacterized protein (TIGR00730 family)
VSVATIPLRVLPVTARGSLTICIYCGAAVGRRKIFEEQTRAAARVIVAAGHRVYGGAKNGLMGVMADEALKLGGTVVGVIPALLVDKELLHKGLSEIHIVASMHERKKKMSELAEVFLALPGGAGTLEELVEQWTWTQLGIHAKPCGVLERRRIFRTIADDGGQDGRRRFPARAPPGVAHLQPVHRGRARRPRAVSRAVGKILMGNLPLRD